MFRIARHPCTISVCIQCGACVGGMGKVGKTGAYGMGRMNKGLKECYSRAKECNHALCQITYTICIYIGFRNETNRRVDMRRCQLCNNFLKIMR